MKIELNDLGLIMHTLFYWFIYVNDNVEFKLYRHCITHRLRLCCGRQIGGEENELQGMLINVQPNK